MSSDPTARDAIDSRFSLGFKSIVARDMHLDGFMVYDLVSEIKETIYPDVSYRTSLLYLLREYGSVKTYLCV